MEYEELAITLSSELQKQRGDVPTFVLADGFSRQNVLKVRTELLGMPHGPEIDIILHSLGGNADDAYRLIRAFRTRYDVVNIIVPFWAKSAATIFAFGGTRILLHEFGELGPLDAQIKKDDDDGLATGYASALNVQSSLEQIESRARVGVIEMMKTVGGDPDIRISRKQLFDMLLSHSSHFYEPLLQKTDTMEIGSMARYLQIGAMYAERILKQYSTIDEDKLRGLLDFLVYGAPDHGYVVDYSSLKPYLDNVHLANEPPFGEDYYNTLEQLSLVLTGNTLGRIGYVNKLMDELESKKQEANGNIESERKEASQNGSNSTTKSKRKQKNAPSKLPKSSSSKKSRKNKTK